MVALMYIFDVDILTTTDDGVVQGIVTALWLFGPASASFTYCLTFAFTSPSWANMFCVASGFIIGMAGPLTCFILELLAIRRVDPNPELADVAHILSGVLRIFPPFNLGKAIFNSINILAYKYFENDLELTVWSEPVLLYEVLMLILTTMFYLFLAIQLDK